MSVWVKICGITRVCDAEAAAALGADAIGLNFARQSPRHVEPEMAIDLAKAARAVRPSGSDPFEVVGVFVDEKTEHMVDVARRVGLTSLQLHGDEAPSQLATLEQMLGAAPASGRVYKAVRISEPADVQASRKFLRQRLLADAKVVGALGGTGHSFDWSLVADLNRACDLILAGGLRPDNVREAISSLRPFGVDTASGVESAPGIKDEELLRQFVSLAKAD